jgi:hypothetical protein
LIFQAAFNFSAKFFKEGYTSTKLSVFAQIEMAQQEKRTAWTKQTRIPRLLKYDYELSALTVLSNHNIRETC